MKLHQLFSLCFVLSSNALLTSADETGDKNNQAPSWRFSTLAGLAITPTYLGDDSTQLTLLPDFRAEFGDRFSASLLTGIQYDLLSTSHWRAGPVLKYDFGRDELEGNPLNLAGSDTTDLIGLGDIDGSLEAGAYLAYQTRHWQTKIEIRQGLDGGHEGLVGEASFKYNAQTQIFNRTAFYSIGPELVYGDESYLQAYFGITNEQSINANLTTYQADSGLVSYGLHANLFVPLNTKWSLGTFVGINSLGSQAKNSPLIIERGSNEQVVAGLFFTYQF